MAGPTRLELATSGVTGRRSNQLNYDPTSQRQRIITHKPDGIQGCLKKKSIFFASFREMAGNRRMRRAYKPFYHTIVLSDLE
jgi:hypothetical protein